MAADENLGEIFVQIKADYDQLEKEFKQLKSKVDRDAEQMGNSFSKILKKAILAGGAIFVFRKALDISREAKNLARDAEEISSKFDTVFSGIKSKANSMADNFAKNFGLAGSTARELLSDTGDLLVGFEFAEEEALSLSEQVNSLAQDLVSFKNYSGGAKGASQALTKALFGETEAAKGLGIVIQQDTKEFKLAVQQMMNSRGISEKQAKALVILSDAYKQSRKAVGDYNRTKDSTANVERRANELLKTQYETLGKQILPVYTIFLQLIAEMSTNMGDASGATNAFGTALKSVATPIIIIATMLKQIANIAGTLGATLAHLGLAPFGLSNDVKVLGSLKSGWEIMLKDSENMNNALYNMWSTTSNKIQNLKMTPEDVKGMILSPHRYSEEDKSTPDWSPNSKKLKEVEDRVDVLKEKLKGLEIGSPDFKNTIADINKLEKLIDDEKSGYTKVLKQKLDQLNKFYQVVTFNDSSYFDWRLKEYQKEAEEYKKILGKEFNEAAFINEKKKQLFNDYVDHLKSTLSQATNGNDVFTFNSKGEIETPISSIGVTTTREQKESKPILNPEPFQESSEEIVETWATSNEIMTETFYSTVDGIANSFHELVQVRIARDASAFEKIWANAINAVLMQMQQLIAKWAVLNVLSYALGGGGISMSKIIGGASGGSFIGTGSGVKKMAGGGSFVVPPGHPNDTYPMLLRSGEKARITPSHKVGQEEKILSNLYKSIESIKYNIAEQPPVVVKVFNKLDREGFTQYQLMGAENNLTLAGVNPDEQI